MVHLGYPGVVGMLLRLGILPSCLLWVEVIIWYPTLASIFYFGPKRNERSQDPVLTRVRMGKCDRGH